MRANGLLSSQGSGRGSNEEESEEYAEQDLQFADSGSRDPLSGAPNTINSVVVEYLLAGFSPARHPPLAGKIARVAAEYIRKNVTFRLDSKSSRTVIVIADPLHVLEEGEVFYQSTDPIIYSTHSSPVLIGPALVSRAQPSSPPISKK